MEQKRKHGMSLYKCNNKEQWKEKNDKQKLNQDRKVMGIQGYFEE